MNARNTAACLTEMQVSALIAQTHTRSNCTVTETISENSIKHMVKVARIALTSTQQQHLLETTEFR